MTPTTRQPDDPRATPVMLRRDLVSEGWNDRAIRRMVRSNEWAKPRTGAYVSRAAWVATDDVGRHEITARAVLAQSKTPLVLSHVSGAAVWDVPLWDEDLGLVQVTRPDGRAGRKEAGVQQHRGVLRPEEVTVRHGLPVVSAARLALELTMGSDVEHALSYVNHLLHVKATDLDQLRDHHQTMDQWPGSLTTDLVLRLAEPRCESIGESRTQYLCWRQSLPAPKPQYAIEDRYGNVIARLDFAWPEHGVFLEFDGKVKYTALVKEGDSITDVVLREKQREDLICELTGWRCMRLVWADLYRPEHTALRIRRLLDSTRVPA